MTIQLLKGDYCAADALVLMESMIMVKIRFHENKISNSHTEEDIKYREDKIKRLQQQLADCKNEWKQAQGTIRMESAISIRDNSPVLA